MKSVLGFMLLISTLAFGQTRNNSGHSYGYMLLDNGNTYTLRSYFDETLVPMFNPEGYFTLPEEIDAAGSNYYMDKNEMMFTVDSNGWLYKKMEYMQGHTMAKAGGVFFLTKKTDSENRAGHIVRNDGYIIEHHDDGFELFDKVRHMGGVYFTTLSGYIVIANPYDGKFYRHSKDLKIKRKQVSHYGHNYILLNTGKLITIGFVPKIVRNDDGSIGTKYEAVVNQIYRNYDYKNVETAGGTYFFNRRNQLISINDKGEVRSKGYVSDYSAGKDMSAETPIKLGTNYLVYEDGEVFMLDQHGEMKFLKELPYYERVGRGNFNYKD